MIPGWKDPLEKGTATHSSILAWRIPMDRGAWKATVHWVTKSWTCLSDFNSHIHVFIQLQTPLPSRLPDNIEKSSLCYTVGACWLSILNIAKYTCSSQTPNYPLPPSLPPTTVSSFSKSVNLFLLCEFISIISF